MMIKMIQKCALAAMMAVTANVCGFAQPVDTATDSVSSTFAEAKPVRPKFHGPGFRCFIGVKNEVGIDSWDFSHGTIFAVAGSQVNPYLFVGAGAGLSSWLFHDFVSAPLFVDLRTEVHKATHCRTSPYAELQIGYSVGDVKGLYVSPQVGCHFSFGRRPLGISVALSYSVQRADVYDWITKQTSRENLDGLGLSVSFDF